MKAASKEAEPTAEVECVGCRQPGPRRDLERFVYHESVGLVFDMRGGAPGRELYVHPLPGCIRAAAWAGFSRSIEKPLRDLDGEELVERVAEGLRTRLEEQVAEAARLDALYAGRSAVEHAERTDQLERVLVDPEAGDAIRRMTDRWAEASGIAVFETIPSGLLTAAAGRQTAIAGLASGRRAEAIGRTAEKLICIEQNEG